MSYNAMIDLLTSAEAAASLGITPAAIRKAVQYGTLHGTLRGKMWFFERAEIERYRTKHLGRKGQRQRHQPPA